MTESTQPDPSKTGAIAQKIVAILASEDSETRRRAVQAAMLLLGEQPLPAAVQTSQESGDGVANDDLEAFFSRGEGLKPHECAYLCAAYHYANYGGVVFSLNDLRVIATDAGVVLPDRLDMTLKQAGKGGRKLFLAAGRDSYKPTAAAGVLFREKWNVKPGKKPKDSAESV